MISGEKVSWNFATEKGTSCVLKDVSFQIEKSRITTFMGPSGAGKTTLLKCVANLYPEYEGKITYDGKDIKSFAPLERVSTIGFVLQQFHLFPHLSALNNCTYALVHAMGMPRLDAEARALETLGLLGMLPFVHALPAQLSGGQQQRVAIARALVLRPEVLLLDEPTSALDPESKKGLESLLVDLNARGLTLALSSHDMPFIHKIMDKVYFMEQGELVEQWDRQKEELASKDKIKQFLKDI